MKYLFVLFLLVSCNEQFKVTPADTVVNTPLMYELKKSGTTFISPINSTDPTATVCIEEGGIFLIDPDSRGTNYCLKVDPFIFKEKVAEINSLCNAANMLPADRDLYISTATSIDTNLDELEAAEFLCPYEGSCWNGKELYYDKFSDILEVREMPGCS